MPLSHIARLALPGVATNSMKYSTTRGGSCDGCRSGQRRSKISSGSRARRTSYSRLPSGRHWRASWSGLTWTERR